MAAFPDKMRITEFKEDDDVVTPPTEDSDIASSFAERNRSATSKELDDIAAFGNKQPKPLVDKQKKIKRELQGKNNPNEECDNGRSNRFTLLKTSMVIHGKKMNGTATFQAKGLGSTNFQTKAIARNVKVLFVFFKLTGSALIG